MSELMMIAPVTLPGRHVRLEPLTMEHAAGLVEVGLDNDLWKWIPTPVRTFRNHMITASGRIRHTVYFSVIDSEWPEVKARLETRLR